MTMERKGTELSMNVIIIAVISLLVLVIIVYLVANQSTIFGQGKACFEKGGTCKEYGSSTNPIIQSDDGKALCQSRNDVCYKLTPE